MVTFIPVKGHTGSVFFVNADHIRLIKPSKDPKSARLIFVNANGEEEAMSVQGTPAQIARLVNRTDAKEPSRSSAAQAAAST